MIFKVLLQLVSEFIMKKLTRFFSFSIKHEGYNSYDDLRVCIDDLTSYFLLKNQL